MPELCIPRALDRHLVSATHAAATAGDFALGAFDAVVEQIVRTLREQGIAHAAIERVFSDVFAGLAFPYARTPVAERYSALESRAIAIARRTRPHTPPGGVASRHSQRNAPSK